MLGAWCHSTFCSPRWVDVTDRRRIAFRGNFPAFRQRLLVTSMGIQIRQYLNASSRASGVFQ